LNLLFSKRISLSFSKARFGVSANVLGIKEVAAGNLGEKQSVAFYPLLYAPNRDEEQSISKSLLRDARS